jgi:hypothetical protein
MKKLILLLSCSFALAAAQAQIIRVPGDYPTIQQGINHAAPGDTVLVAEGTYYEQINFLGKKPLMVASQYLVDGNAGHIANTIIDGSLLTNSDSASVVYFVSGGDTTSILCGFTIRNGKGTYTPDNFEDRQGGGIWIAGAGAKIIYNRITHNTLDDTQPMNGNSTFGGGIGGKWEDAGYWVVIGNNTIDSNTCISKYEYAGGAGIGLAYNTRIFNNIIQYNTCSGIQTAHAGGAGIVCEKLFSWSPATALIEGNAITHNLIQSQSSWASIAGVSIGSVQGLILNNEVAFNTVITGTNEGGATGLELYNPDPGSVVSGNVFRGNVSNLWSGGLHLQNDLASGNTVLVENNYFLDNVAKKGGAFVTIDVPVTLQNNVFSGNHADISGGAMYLWGTSGQSYHHLATLVNNSFSKNSSAGPGGAIFSYFADPAISNCIFWQDSSSNAKEIYAQTGSVEIAHSDIDTNEVKGVRVFGPGIFNADPLFDNSGYLKSYFNSPCIDKGVADYICSHGDTIQAPKRDIYGLSRPRGAGMDLGAYEHSAIIHIPADFPTIQKGIDAATPGDTVLVAEGTYYEQINFKGKKPLIVASQFLMDGDTSHISKTIIDGSQLSNPDSATVVYFVSGEDTTSVICGFTIQGGKGTYWNVWQSYIGGGIWIDSSSATVRNNIIQNNILNDSLSSVSLGGCGAGIASSYGYPGWTIIENNTIRNNQVITKFDWIEGAGIYNYVTNTRIKNNRVTGNQGKNFGYGYTAGGGILVWSDYDNALIIQAEVTGNVIENNEAWANSWIGGGGIFLGLAKTTFTNNIVNGNKSVCIPPFLGAGFYQGGGLHFEYMTENSVISNNIFSNNKCDGNGGGIHIWLPNFTDLPIQDNYFTGNEAVNGGAVAVEDSACLVRLENNVFSHNSSTSRGGAIWINRGNGSPEEHLTVSINNSFYDNQADTLGGAFYVTEDNPVLFNSIFWQNPDVSGSEITVESGYAEIAYSDLDTNKINGPRIIGAGMINADPLFSDVSLLTIEHWSPCVDKGAKDFTCNCGILHHCPGYDLTGITRPVGVGYDMGAYDLQAWGQGISQVTIDDLRLTNYPNPFTGSTTFIYSLKEPSQVTIQIFNSFGQLVAEPVNSLQQKGQQEVHWNAGDLPAGIYYYRLQAWSLEESGKMVKY